MVSEMEQQKLDEVRERFSHDRFATVNGAVIEEIAEGYAKCSMQIKCDHKNALGAVMGACGFCVCGGGKLAGTAGGVTGCFDYVSREGKRKYTDCRGEKNQGRQTNVLLYG